MKKVLCVLLILVICLSMAVTVFATEGDFVSSPGESGSPCDHEHTKIENKKDATCNKDGYTGDEVCTECGEIIKKGKVIPKLGHKFVDGVCTICGASDVPKTGDHNNMILWVVLMVMSAAALSVVTSACRKNA